LHLWATEWGTDGEQKKAGGYKKWLSRCCRQKTVSVWPQPCEREEGKVDNLGTAVQKIKQLLCQCQNNGKEAHEGRVGEKAKPVACATQ